jgi:NADP oxidoreductase coenzyme F420-dependent
VSRSSRAYVRVSPPTAHAARRSHRSLWCRQGCPVGRVRGFIPWLITQRPAVVHVGSDIAAWEFSPSARATRVMCCFGDFSKRSKDEHRNHRRRHIGGTLTRRLRALGHTVAVANSRGPESLAALATETGATAVSVAEAARDKDLMIVTIPEKDIPKLPAGLFADAAGSIVVDTGNYYPRQRDGRIEPGRCGANKSASSMTKCNGSALASYRLSANAAMNRR